MKVNIHGYIVLRKPQYNFDKEGRGAFLKEPPEACKLYYGGIDRMPWFDIDEHYYANTLPSEMRELRQKIWNQKLSYSDLELCSNYTYAVKMLEFSGTHENEIVAVFSHGLPTDISFEAEVIKCSGCDLYSDGYGSILHQGIFSKESLFEEYLSKINDNGLLNCEDDTLRNYTQKYLRHMKNSNLEVVIDEPAEILIYKC